MLDIQTVENGFIACEREHHNHRGKEWVFTTPQALGKHIEKWGKEQNEKKSKV